MIYRKHQIKLQDAEVSFMISYTRTDVLNWIREYVSMDMEGLSRKEIEERLMDYTQPCDWITSYFLKNPHIFGWLPTKYAMPLSEWVITQGIKSGYLIDTGTMGNNGKVFRFPTNLMRQSVALQESDKTNR